MEKIDKIMFYTELYQVYKNLLSNSQKEILYDYYFMDLSLSEIASERGISRSAVEDALSKGNKRLEELEEDLKVVEKNRIIAQKLAILEERALNMREINELEDVKKELK